MTPEKQQIVIAEACGKQVLPVVEGITFYKKFEWLNSYVKECRSVGKDVSGDFWERVKPDILDGSFPHTLIDGRSSHKLQYLTRGWVHTTARNPLGLWILGDCSQAFDKEPKPEEGREGFAMQVWCAKDVPDYLNDRDAMVEALKTLTPRQREVFASDLTYPTDPVLGDQSCIGYIELPASDVFDLLIADVPLLAKTFLRTLNLWIED